MMEPYLKPRWSGVDRLEIHDEQGDTLMVKAVTYSWYRWLDLRKLWDTGYDYKGGLILYGQGPEKRI